MKTANSLSQLGSFAPHGQCFLWNTDLVLLHAISDSITALAYYSIPIALLYFVKKRQDLPYKWIFVLFGAFILACGTTHVMAVWTIWKPDYWLEGAIKGGTAAVSLVTAGLLWPMMPRLLRLPSPAQLDAANQELQKEIAVRRHVAAELAGIRQYLEKQVQERTAELSQANKALHADIAKRMRAEKELLETTQALQSLIQASPVGIVVLDCEGKIRQWNPASERIFGWCEKDVLGRLLPTIPPDKQEEHRAFRERVLNDNAFTDLEVRRLKKDGALIDISLSTAPVRDAGGNIVGVLGLMTDITERKRAKEELEQAHVALNVHHRELQETHTKIEQAKKEWEATFNAIADPLFIHDHAFRIVRANQAYADVAGMPQAELLGRPYYEVFPRMDGPFKRCLKAMEQGVRKKEEEEEEEEEQVLGQTPGKRYRMRLFSMQDSAGKYVHSIHIMEDITERKQAEKALTLFRTLLDRVHDSLEVIDPATGRFLDVNEQACLDLGYTRDELLSMTISDIDPIVNRSVFDLNITRLRTARALTLESIHRRKDGTTFPVEINVTLVRVEREYVMAVVRDITERMQMENALRTLAEYARSLIEASLDPLMTISKDGKITDVNTASEAVTGLPRERLIGSDFSDYCTEPDKAWEGYRQVLSQGAVRDYPLTIRHATGRLTDVLYNATVYCNRAGAVQGVLVTARDITERKQMEGQAARTERLAALGQLLGGIAHEVKNPLFIVTGRIQLLKEMLANGEYDAMGKNIQSIEEAGKRMTMITQRFLNLARPLKPQ